MRRGSILILVLWIIAVLSVMVLSFAHEAHLQTGINVYVRERNRVSRLVDAGQTLAEVVIAGFADVKDYEEGEDEAELDEDDRWYREKRQLKSSSKCTVGPIVVDEENPEGGTVTIDIELSNAGQESAINVNELYSGDSNYRLRWELLLTNYCGIPEDFEVEAKDASYSGNVRVRLIDLLITSWNDWRDENDTPETGDPEDGGKACGAESQYYEELYEDLKTDEEDMIYPRNAAIPDVKELAKVRGFRDYPAVLTGGILNPEDDKDEQITVRGITDLLGTTGTAKLNVNNCTADQLLTIPGIGNEDMEDADGAEDAKLLAQAIVDTLKVEPDRDDIDPAQQAAGFYPYKDWNDLVQRLSDNDEYGGDAEIGQEANNYLTFVPDSESIFKVKITAESMGMKREAQAVCYLKDKKVRYIEWRED